MLQIVFFREFFIYFLLNIDEDIFCQTLFDHVSYKYLFPSLFLNFPEL